MLWNGFTFGLGLVAAGIVLWVLGWILLILIAVLIAATTSK